MEKIQFDNGVREYGLEGGGVLRFNPGDPNLYARFMEAAEKVCQVEQMLLPQGDPDGGDGLLKLLQEADRKMKELLSWVFGPQNDFDKILGGVNLLAVGQNGKRVMENLLEALQPILLAGARSCAKKKVRAAEKAARARREEQC